MIDKVLFLDIDGVLNCRGCISDHRRDQLGTDHIRQLNRVVGLTNASVVISSTWRKIYPISNIQQMLDRAGYHYSSRIIGKTPSLWTIRGLEIQDWLDNHNVNRFAIVDDDSDMGVLLRHLVKTSFDTGLTMDKADELIKKLGVA